LKTILFTLDANVYKIYCLNIFR